MSIAVAVAVPVAVHSLHTWHTRKSCSLLLCPPKCHAKEQNHKTEEDVYAHKEKKAWPSWPFYFLWIHLVAVMIARMGGHLQPPLSCVQSTEAQEWDFIAKLLLDFLLTGNSLNNVVPVTSVPPVDKIWGRCMPILVLYTSIGHITCHIITFVIFWEGWG